MAFATTLHIGRPYMLYAPGRSRRPGGVGHCRAVGWAGGRGGAGGGRGGRGEGHGSLSRRPPGACTPRSGRVKSDMHPAMLPPRLHECAGRKPCPRGGIVPRAGGVGWGDPGAGITTYHTAYTRGMEASTVPAAACESGGAARDPSPRERHLTMPPWVTPTQWPRSPLPRRPIPRP